VGKAVALHSLTLIGLVFLGEAHCPAQTTGAQVVSRDGKRVAKMVDDLANRNKLPKIVERRAGRPRKLPLFPEEYDWKEDERVRKAVQELYQDTTVDLWEELVRKAHDPRYCNTTWDAGEEAVILSVGDVCRRLAYGRLCDGFKEHLPSFPPHGCPIQLESAFKDLPAWRKERQDNPLYQLQIEVCEMAIRELPKVDSKVLSDREKADARKEIETEITNLRRTEEPIFREYSWFGSWYGPELAKEVRKAVESGSAEDILLEK
jgi:hypothetical protein